ncbi:MAG: hypothetical protein RLZZ227_2040 [Pseudomonadota bacterium]|jgi:hypothetical protein
MAIQLMKLRHVPPDELEEIHALLEAHAIEVYETSAGNWGISMPALWLPDESRFDEARTLLDAYAAERQQRARSEYATLKAAGRARTFVDIARENPLRFVGCLALVGVVAWFSLAPFF